MSIEKSYFNAATGVIEAEEMIYAKYIEEIRRESWLDYKEESKDQDVDNLEEMLENLISETSQTKNSSKYSLAEDFINRNTRVYTSTPQKL